MNLQASRSVSAVSDAATRQPRTAVFTICSNNYLPGARVLMKSLARFHPDFSLFVGLADTRDPMPGLYDGPFEVVAADEIGIPGFKNFAFSYDIMEFNTAIKPFMFGYLFEKMGFDRVIYFDPDILLFAPLDPIINAFDTGASFVLTPHLREPAEGGSDPDDIAIMRAGIYNLGFLGASRPLESLPLIHWWQRRLYRHCINAQDKGIFVDQKFMDLIPGFADNCRILRHPGLNLAYWNLGHTALGYDGDDGKWTANGLPLIFFHFSGFDIRKPGALTKHSRNFRAPHEPALAALLNHYANQMWGAGFGTIPAGTFAYGRFASGAQVPMLARRMFRETTPDWPTDPFTTYEAYLQQAAPDTNRENPCTIISNFQAWLREHFPNLRQHLDLRRAHDAWVMTDWYVNHFAREQGIDLRLIEPVAQRLGNRPPALSHVPEESWSRSDVTVVGYLKTISGVGMVARHVLSSLVDSPLEVDGFDVALGVVSDRSEESLDAHLSKKIDGRVQIFASINADQLPIVLESVKPQMKPGYRIGMPAWELEKFPDAWVGSFDGVDELWAQSKWVQRMLAGRVDKPVIYMPVPLALEAPDTTGVREKFCLPEDSFLFYTSFDFLSFIERKNPEAVVAAFKECRRLIGKDRHVALVIKTLNASFAKGKAEALYQLVEEDPDIILLDGVLSRQETLELMAACDCVVSLHRCEGLGFLVAEGMALGKPVIATDYSATTDLLDENTGYPVNFRYVPVKAGEYPMAEGQRWADPDVVHATWIMHEIVSDPEAAARKGAAAKKMIDTHFNVDVIRTRQLARLKTLGVTTYGQE